MPHPMPNAPAKCLTFLRSACLAMLVFCAQGCAEKAPVPGGTTAINQPYFNSGNDLKTRVDKLVPGMSEEEALKTLGIKKAQMTLLDRIGIRCHVEPLEFAALIDRMKNHKFQAAFGGWGSGILLKAPNGKTEFVTAHHVSTARADEDLPPGIAILIVFMRPPSSRSARSPARWARA